MAAKAHVGDRLFVESERVGQQMREGEIVEVLGVEADHYRVRWQDGHESVFFPSAGSVKIVPAGPKGKGTLTR